MKFRANPDKKTARSDAASNDAHAIFTASPSRARHDKRAPHCGLMENANTYIRVA
jgi:hypothetical protein